MCVCVRERKGGKEGVGGGGGSGTDCWLCFLS